MHTPDLFKTGRHLFVSGVHLGKTAALSILVGSAPLGKAAEMDDHSATNREHIALSDAPPPCQQPKHGDTTACSHKQSLASPTFRYGAMAAGGAVVIGSVLAGGGGGGKSGGKEESKDQAGPVAPAALQLPAETERPPEEAIPPPGAVVPPPGAVVPPPGAVVPPPGAVVPPPGAVVPPPSSRSRQNITISHDRQINGAADSPHQTLDISGEHNAVTVTGKTTLNGGLAGITGTGNVLSVTLHGNSEIHDNHSRAAHLVGNHTRVMLSGNTLITTQGTGIDITGSNAEVVHSGRMEMLHDHAVGTRLTGDMARYIEEGRLDLRTPWGHGVQVIGNNAHIQTERDSQIDVTHSATALSLSGDRGTVLVDGRMTLNHGATGLALAGHHNHVELSSGDIQVRGGNGVALKLRGNNNRIVQSGQISLRPNELLPARQLAEPLTAIWINGDNNNVSINNLALDGQLLRLGKPRWLAGHGQTFGITSRSNGLRIEGNANLVNVNGPVFYRQVTKPLEGSQLAGLSETEEPLRTRPGLLVDVIGKSSVIFNNKINVRGTFDSTPTLFRASRGATLTLAKGASLDTDELTIIYPAMFPIMHSLMEASGTGSILENASTVTLHSGAGLAARDQGKVMNKGKLSSRLESTLQSASDAEWAGPLQGAYAMAATGAGSEASNRGALFVSLANNVAAHKSGSPALVMPQFNALRPGNTAMIAINAGQVRNETSSSIKAEGIGANGMSAYGHLYYPAQPTTLAWNLGSIDVNPATSTKQTLLRDSALVDSDFNRIPLAAHEYALGMSAGSQRGNDGGAVAVNAVTINDGTITVHNAGAGMAATGEGSMALNRGVIRLLSNNGVQVPADNLYAMLAMDGGLIVNASQGLIDIRTPAGKAFRLINGGMLVNQGKVRLDNKLLPAEHPQWGAAANAELTNDFPQHKKDASLTQKDTTANLDKSMFSPGLDTAPVSLHNNGTLMLNAHALTLSGKDQLFNDGLLAKGKLITRHSSAVVNRGTFDDIILRADAPLINGMKGHIRLNRATPSFAYAMHNSGRLHPARLFLLGHAVNARNGVILMTPGATLLPDAAMFENAGEIKVELKPDQRGTQAQSLLTIQKGLHDGGEILNTGLMVASDGFAVLKTQAPAGPTRILFSNRGNVSFSTGYGTTAALRADHAGVDLLNDLGTTLAINGDRAIGMTSNADGQLVNRGIIELGKKGSHYTGLVAMSLGHDATGTLLNDTTGVIIIHTKQSSAFEIAGPNGKLINRGKVLLQCGNNGGCSILRNAHTKTKDVSGTEEDKTLVLHPRIQARIAVERNAGGQTPLKSLDNYQISTTASGGAGTLSADNLSLGDVTIDTRFSAGTSARKVVLDKLIVGNNLAGADNIRSTTGVWRAHGHHDADGHIGVTLVKNDYRDLITDASLAPVAEALERSYTSNALFRSLELPGREDFTRALRQLSGAGFERPLQATSTLEHRFGLMAETVTEDTAGFGFKMLGRGQPGSRLGASAYDMVALQQRFESGTAQLAVRYGFARVSPDGGKGRDAALDGHSQFLGARYARPLLSGLALEGDFGYVLHQYSTQRTLRYGNALDRHDKKDANRQLQANHRRDLLGSQVNLALTRNVGSVVLEPLLGVKLRYQRDGALKERHGGDFGLQLSSRHQAALDAVLGLRLSHDGRDGKAHGWLLGAQFHARPTLLRHTGQREASLAGAPDARFALVPAHDSHRFNYDGRLGLSHQGRHGRLSLDGYLSRDDGSSDHGLMASWRLSY